MAVAPSFGTLLSRWRAAAGLTKEELREHARLSRERDKVGGMKGWDVDDDGVSEPNASAEPGVYQLRILVQGISR